MLLTKSKYLIGLQCPLQLWINFHEADKIPKVKIPTQKRFDEGHMIGELAKKLFLGGINLPTEDFSGNLQLTRASLEEGKPLFEPGFLTEDNLYSRGDILVPNNGGWDIIEVKSGTRVKEVNVHDISFQKYVYEKCGLKINKCFLMHLNNEYLKEGELELEKLFVKEDITDQVEKVMPGVSDRILEMKNIIDDPIRPSNKIGPHCNSPYDCPLQEECWSFLPENHVFQLYKGKTKAFELIENNIFSLSDIPVEYKLDDKQGIQKDCDISKKVYIDKERIKHFLKTLNYPIYYLDFETFQTAVPIFDFTKPYQQIPFQFSLHVVSEEGREAKHYSFLYDGSGDPRSDFASALKDVIESEGSIVVYNQSFEIARLKELAEFLPSCKDWVENVISRVVDLIVPFRNFSYYNPLQKGSASLKYVLPALTGKNYSELEISEGFSASLEYFRINYSEVSDEEKFRVRKALEDYCCLDTLGMVWIVDELRKII